jgi:hypothetical protein
MEFLYLVGLATPAAVIAIIVLACYVTSYKNSAEMWENKYRKEIGSLKQDLDRKREDILKSKKAADMSIENAKITSSNNDEKYNRQLRDIDQRSKDLDRKKKEIEDYERQKIQELEEIEESLKKDPYIRRLIDEVNLHKNLSDEKTQTYPWFAALLAQYQKERNDYETSLLSNRATTSREIVKTLKDQNAELKYRSTIAENQILLYESLFPWLEEFKTADIESAVEYIRSTNKDEDYDAIRKWLSPEEYLKLSISEKNQLALDRYLNRNKSDWEIGVEYERFVGYQYEMKGYRVKYIGATEGMKDMGRDLVCEKDGHIVIIQCKRWSEKKTIHEKHIFQLFGSVMQMRFENPNKTYDGLFITTTKLSDLAKLCAKQLKIEVVENYQYRDYSCIKCNVGRNGEKIYHLPFDQQYDRVVVDYSKGERYAMTVKEAELHGFRRAFKHYS